MSEEVSWIGNSHEARKKLPSIWYTATRLTRYNQPWTWSWIEVGARKDRYTGSCLGKGLHRSLVWMSSNKRPLTFARLCTQTWMKINKTVKITSRKMFWLWARGIGVDCCIRRNTMLVGVERWTSNSRHAFKVYSYKLIEECLEPMSVSLIVISPVILAWTPLDAIEVEHSVKIEILERLSASLGRNECWKVAYYI